MNYKNLLDNQIRAGKTIHKKFGQKKALEFYLIDALYYYLKEKKNNKAVANILPALVQEIKNQFDDKAINEYLTSIKEENQTEIFKSLHKAL